MAIVELLESSACQIVMSGNLVYSTVLQLLRIDHEYFTTPIGKNLGYYWSPDAAACTGSDYTQMEDSTMTAFIKCVKLYLITELLTQKGKLPE